MGEQGGENPICRGTRHPQGAVDMLRRCYAAVPGFRYHYISTLLCFNISLEKHLFPSYSFYGNDTGNTVSISKYRSIEGISPVVAGSSAGQRETRMLEEDADNTEEKSIQ